MNYLIKFKKLLYFKNHTKYHHTVFNINIYNLFNFDFKNELKYTWNLIRINFIQIKSFKIQYIVVQNKYINLQIRTLFYNK